MGVNDNGEFISLGGLVSGLSKQDICSGISQPRNKKIIELFHRLNYVESYGTGIRRIMSYYKEYEVRPEICISPNAFIITIPNMNKQRKKSSNNAMTNQMLKIIEYLRTNEETTDEEVQELLDIKKTRAYNIIKKMESEGIIYTKGRGKNKKIFLK